MTDKAQQAHEGEERLAGQQTRPKSAVQVKGGERLWRRRQAEAYSDRFRADSDERIEKWIGASHVPARGECLDVANLGQQCIELRRADLPLDPRRRTHE